MPNQLFHALENVNDEDSFLIFVRALHEDRLMSEPIPLAPDGFKGEWANNSIVEFLEAAISWANDSSFGNRPGPKPSNPWALCAQFLWAGRDYE